MFIHSWFLTHRGLGVHLLGDFAACAVGITHLFDRCSQGTTGQLYTAGPFLVLTLA